MARAGGDDALFELSAAGHERRAAGAYYYDARLRQDRPHVVLQCTLAGSGFIAEGPRRTRRPLPANATFVRQIPGPFEYGIEPDAREPYEFVYVCMRGPAADAWYRRIVADFGTVLDLGDGGPALARQMLDLTAAFRAGRLSDRYQTSAKLYLILMTLYGLMRHGRVARRPRVAAAIDAIRARAGDPAFNVQRLAALLDCSREHLGREFLAATGRTPGAHLTEERFRLAVRLLRDGRSKIEAIARASGFGSGSYFCRAFRARTGVTPARFRAQPWLVASFDTADPF